jgi:hypothetical protein
MTGDVNDFREWLLVAGTLGAVVVALGVAFYGRLRAWRERPKLSLSFDPSAGSETLDLVSVGTLVSGNPPISHWARIRIENGRGRRSAQDVEVLVTRFRRCDEAAWVQPPLDTRPLRWSNSTLSESDGGLSRVTIPPGVARHCDLVALAPPLLVHDYEGSGSGDLDRGEFGAIATLQIDPAPTDRRHWIATGAYELELAICARDVNARFYSTTIEFRRQVVRRTWGLGEAPNPPVRGRPRPALGPQVSRSRKATVSGRALPPSTPCETVRAMACEVAFRGQIAAIRMKAVMRERVPAGSAPGTIGPIVQTADEDVLVRALQGESFVSGQQPDAPRQTIAAELEDFRAELSAEVQAVFRTGAGLEQRRHGIAVGHGGGSYGRRGCLGGVVVSVV